MQQYLHFHFLIFVGRFLDLICYIDCNSVASFSLNFSQFSPEDEALLSQIRTVENDMARSNKKLDEVAYDLNGLDKVCSTLYCHLLRMSYIHVFVSSFVLHVCFGSIASLQVDVLS